MTTSTKKTSKTDSARILRRIRSHLGDQPLPSVSLVAVTSRDPFRILISTMISLRTRDEVTLAATDRLFAQAETPQAIAALPEEAIANSIYPAGFYRTKAHNIREVARIVSEEYHGSVPQTVEKLIALPGVGRKTANLVLGLGYGIAAICVDTHVHRIANRLGWVETRTPDATEAALEKILPAEWWIAVNELLVLHGQQVCTPQSPLCSRCPVEGDCRQVGVTRRR